MVDEMLELDRFRAEVPPADHAAMARARATLVHTATSPVARRRRSPARIAATATAGAAVAAGFLIVSSDHAPVASAVTMNDDGTVTVDLAELHDVAAANQVLADAGIRAVLLTPEPPDGCVPATEQGGRLRMPSDLIVENRVSDTDIVTFRPDRIPADMKLLLPSGDEGEPTKLVVWAVSVSTDPNDPNVGECMEHTIYRVELP